MASKKKRIKKLVTFDADVLAGMKRLAESQDRPANYEINQACRERLKRAKRIN